MDALLNVIRSVAEDKGVTIAQTVIAWTLEQPGCSHALVGARNADQAIANAKAGEIVDRGRDWNHSQSGRPD